MARSRFAKDFEASKALEMQVYIDSMTAMYKKSLLQNGELFDLAFELTDGFTSITPECFIKDSRIIKIFRYAIAPSISQMKFGQFVGLRTVSNLESDQVTHGARLRTLHEIAARLCEFVNKNLDHSRFPWIDNKLDNKQHKLAIQYAKNWTCSIIADQNAQTEYRNWRKTRQEAAIEKVLIDSGFVLSGLDGDLTNSSQIKIGEYSKERKVQGGTLQKADLVVRCKRKSTGLLLLEAKAVGVQVDAYKRIKECCDKARDWRGNKDLGEVTVVAVIAGFFGIANIDALDNASVEVVWEHDLNRLKEYL